MVVRSGGGLHRYFDGCGLAIRNWQRLHGIGGLDGRGHGGFIVLPPSIHPETGERYEFLTELLPVTALPKFDLAWLKLVRKEPSGLRRILPPRFGLHRPIEDVRKR